MAANFGDGITLLRLEELGRRFCAYYGIPIDNGFVHQASLQVFDERVSTQYWYRHRVKAQQAFINVGGVDNSQSKLVVPIGMIYFMVIEMKIHELFLAAVVATINQLDQKSIENAELLDQRDRLRDENERLRNVNARILNRVRDLERAAAGLPNQAIQAGDGVQIEYPLIADHQHVMYDAFISRLDMVPDHPPFDGMFFIFYLVDLDAQKTLQLRPPCLPIQLY
jgi:hypothetical protein